MPRTLFLHIGMPKCATTTVQYFLEKNSELLAGQGLKYEKHEEDETKHQGNSALLGAVLLKEDKKRVQRMLDFFLRGSDDVMLSSETLIACARGGMFDWFSQEVRARGYEPQVICYLRRQDFWVESDFKQHVKGHSPWSNRIEALLDRRVNTRTLDYHWMLSNWSRGAGKENVKVVPLNRSQSADYPVRRMMELVGVDVPEERFTMDARNISPPTGLIEPARFIKREAKRKGLTPPQIVDTVHTFLEDAKLNAVVPGRRYLLSFQRRSALLKAYAESNQALAEDYLDGRPAFDSVVQEDDKSESLAEEAADVLSLYAARALNLETKKRRRTLRQILSDRGFAKKSAGQTAP